MKQIIPSIFVALGLISSANAQLFNVAPKKIIKSSQEVPSAQPDNPNKVNISNEVIAPIPDEEIVEPLPVTITPEQKAEINKKIKKNIKDVVKLQTIRNRRDFIDVMTSTEKIVSRRKALLEGKTYSVAKDLEKNIKVPNIDLKNDTDVEQYMYEKVGVTDE